MNFLQKNWTFYGRISDEKTALLHFRPGGVKNLFNLDDFSNYVSSN